jgi:lipoprotein signal peptidase
VLLTGLLDLVVFSFGAAFSFAFAHYLRSNDPKFHGGMLLFIIGISAVLYRYPEGPWVSSICLGFVIVVAKKIMDQ